MDLICPHCKTAHNSTYLDPSLKDIICKICDTEFSIENMGWHDSLPVRYRSPEGSDIRLYWENDNFLEIVLPPMKPTWWKSFTTIFSLSIITSIFGYVFLNLLDFLRQTGEFNIFVGISIFLAAFFLIAVYKNIHEFFEFQKVRINKDQVQVDKVGLLYKSHESFPPESVSKVKLKKGNKKSALQLTGGNKKANILERVSEEEKDWTESLLREVFIEMEKQTR